MDVSDVLDGAGADTLGPFGTGVQKSLIVLDCGPVASFLAGQMCTRRKYFRWPLAVLLLLSSLGVLPQSKHLMPFPSSASLASLVLSNKSFNFSCVPGMLLVFFAALLGILPASVTALAVLSEVVDPEIPGAVDSVAFSNTMFTDAFLNVVIRWIILTSSDRDSLARSISTSSFVLRTKGALFVLPASTKST